MTVKDKEVQEYLSQAERLDAFIESKIDQRVKVMSIATKITADTSSVAVQSSKQESSIQRCIEKLDALDLEIAESLDTLVDLKIEITSVISKIKDNKQRLVLELKYLNMLTFEEIAVKLNYCKRQIERIHKRALEEVVIKCQ